MNDFTNVKILPNPIKTLTFKTNVTKTDSQFNSRLWPDYFRLDEGLWSMTLGDVLIKNLMTTTLTTVFDIKTELVTGFEDRYNTYQKINEPNLFREIYPQFVSNFTTVGSCDVSFKTQNQFKYYPKGSCAWFTVDNAKLDRYRIFIQPRECVTPQTNFKVYMEVNFLFQRLK